MMKRAHTALALAALAALAGLAGCTDLTERPVTGVDAAYFQTTAGANAAAIGTYSWLRSFYGGEFEVRTRMVGTDSWEKGGQLLGDSYWNDYTAQLSPSVGSDVQGIWQAAYQAINAANTAIASIGAATDLDATTKNTRLGEVRFLRALYYFHLVRMYGAAQLNLEPTAGVVIQATRTPAAEIYAKAIVPDLEFAVTNLPVRQSELYRATKGAAQTLLAEVYLTRAASGDFDRARDLTTAVIGSGAYRLNPSFRALFCAGSGDNGACDYAPSQKADPEIVFSVQYVGDGGTDAFGNNLHLYWVMAYDLTGVAAPTLARTPAYGRPYRRVRPTLHLLNLFNRATDSRYEASFQTLWRQPNGDTAIFFPGTQAAVKTGQGRKYGQSEYSIDLYPTLKKWLDQTRADANTFPGHRDRTVWRLADVYLLRAEANIRAGRASEAIADINVLRARAARPGADNTLGPAELTAFNASPIDFLLDERERELAGEEGRWYTLTRQGEEVFLRRVRAFNPGAAANVKAFHMLRPIPQAQIDRTEGGKDAFPQNAGY
jgi:starch-binding outer membrane protein, SusD/RagB family